MSECRVTVLQGGSSQGTTGGGSMCCKACSAVQTETMQCYASTVTKQVGQRLRVHTGDLGNKNS